MCAHLLVGNFTEGQTSLLIQYGDTSGQVAGEQEMFKCSNLDNRTILKA